MGLNLPESHSYDDSLREITTVLDDIANTLGSNLSTPWTFRMVSQAQAAPFAKEYYVWTNSNQKGWPPLFNTGSHRAFLYSLVESAIQLEAFIRVARISINQLCLDALKGFNSGSLSCAFMMLRGLIERTAHCAALADTFKNLPHTKSLPGGDAIPLIEQGDAIAKALYGTRIDWQALRNADIRSAKKEDLAYVRKELSTDFGASNILSSIDKLSKRISGIRIAYDVLCEFLHPNVGDLYSSTIQVNSNMDDFGTRHVRRVLGVGSADLSNSPDLSLVLTQVLLVCSDCLSLILGEIETLEKASCEANNRAKIFAHRLRKRNRSLFRGRDLCPCLSGLNVRDCK